MKLFLMCAIVLLLGNIQLNAARVRSFQTVREEEMSSLVKYLKAKAGSPVNLSEKIFLTACRIVSRSAFHSQRKPHLDQDIEEEEAMIMVCKAVVTMSPDIADLFPSRKWLHALTGATRKYEDLRRRIDTLTDNIIAVYGGDEGGGDGGGGGEDECLLSALLKSKRDGDLTMDNVKAVLLVSAYN